MGEKHNKQPAGKTSAYNRLKITAGTALLAIAALGFAVFSSGINNPFLGDDFAQIVNNIPVHSLGNIKQFFEGSTHNYGVVNGGGTELTGSYYRPLMTTSFSLLYALFGPNPTAYHIFQLLLHILSAFFIFLIFKYLFRPGLSLLLALLFLVHPGISQAVFSIPATQEPLFLLFGLSAFWTLLRFQNQSKSYLILTACLLVLSLFSKESGILFSLISAVYLACFDRKRLYPFLAIICIPLVLYFALRFHAVGLIHNPHNAPIDELPLGLRLINVPAIISFYLGMLIFPIKLAHAYAWVHTSISFQNFWMPLAFSVIAASSIIFVAFQLYKKSRKRHFALFVFFASWTAIGLLLYLQVFPLDFTVAETWLYFPLVGVLGMVGAVLDAFTIRWPVWRLITIFLIIGLMSFRTFIRGFDYQDPFTLAQRDLAVSKDDYLSAANVSLELLSRGEGERALSYAQNSVNSYPSILGYNAMASALFHLGRYSEANDHYDRALALDAVAPSRTLFIHENAAVLAVYYGDPAQNIKKIQNSLAIYPKSGRLWLSLAIVQQKLDNESAKVSIGRARLYGQTDNYFYAQIMSNQPIIMQLTPPLQK